MGSTLFLLLSPHYLHHLISNHSKTPFQNPNSSSNFRCSSSSRPPNWGSNFDAFQSRRSEFGRRENRRNWWSDDDDDDEDEEDMDFGSWEETPTAIDWFFKIFKSFGWMVPAIIITTLLGTGSNSLVMALVLPLGQTALSLVMDKVWGGPRSSPDFWPQTRSRSKSRSRSRRRPRPERNPFARTAYPGNRGARDARSRPRSTNGGYQSWSTSPEGGRSSSNFGGWDELDQQVVSNSSFTEGQRQKVDELEREYTENSKLSRRINRDKPLFIRLLIAVFPLLGSWTRFFF